MIFLDTNIFIRYFEQEDTNESAKSEELFRKIIDGKMICFTNTMVITEIAWMLEKYYGWDKQEVCDNLEYILRTPNIKIRERKILLFAVKTYRDLNIDFSDSYNYAYIKAFNSSMIYSYDIHFEKLNKAYKDIERMVP
jgi:predicted nucleic-acid-binding protein